MMQGLSFELAQPASRANNLSFFPVLRRERRSEGVSGTLQ